MLLQAIHFALLILAVALAIPAGVLLSQILAAGRRKPFQPTLPAPGWPATVVLIPAHDEEAQIAKTVSHVRAQLGPADRILVVADNCTDGTAEAARLAGAEVAVRHDATKRGKGYALDHGVSLLRSAPPAVVLFIDADCELHPGSLAALAHRSHLTQRPVQALDLMHARPGASFKARFGEFAWAVRNHARPQGGQRLGWPCQLMGTGMAIPWPLLANRSLASGSIVEDMELGVSLAESGHPPEFFPQALVTSFFPTKDKGLADQRKRWEQGLLSSIVGLGPRLVASAVRQRRADLLGMAADLCVPPLAWLVLATVMTGLLSAAVAFLGGPVMAARVAAVAVLALFLAVMLAWHRFGRDSISMAEMLKAPWYVLSKLPIYLGAALGRRGQWVRADRDD